MSKSEAPNVHSNLTGRELVANTKAKEKVLKARAANVKRVRKGK